MRVTPPGVVAHSHHPEDNAFETGVKAPYWPEPFSDYSWFMDVKEPGHVVFDFYGTSDMTGNHWDAFISARLQAGSEDLYAEALQQLERHLLTRVLNHTGGNQLQAARILGITRGSLRTKIRALGLTIERSVSSDDENG